MTYLKKPTLSQQQNELKELIEQRLSEEKSEIGERVYQWLNDNQYFVDNELFDFYFCVAQNITSVEVLGGSGEKIVKAKKDLEDSAKAYTNQIVETSNWIERQLESQLTKVLNNQQKLDIKLIQVLEELAREHQDLKIISNGLVKSIAILLEKQKKLLAEIKTARRLTLYPVIIFLVIMLIVLLELITVLLLNGNL